MRDSLLPDIALLGLILHIHTIINTQRLRQKEKVEKKKVQDNRHQAAKESIKLSLLCQRIVPRWQLHLPHGLPLYESDSLVASSSSERKGKKRRSYNNCISLSRVNKEQDCIADSLFGILPITSLKEKAWALSSRKKESRSYLRTK